MAHTIQRLTLYALLSSLEDDLRDFIKLYIGPLVPPAKLIPESAEKKARDRFCKDNPDATPEPDDLIEYLDLGEEIQILRLHDRHYDEATRTYIKKYYIAFEGLISIRNRVMHTRPLEFDDFLRVSDLASELVKSHRGLWAELRTTIKELERNPDFVTRIVIPDVDDDNLKILHNLPQTEFDDTGFIGRDKELRELKRALLGSYPIVTVIGEGGLGKTALALKACYDLLDETESTFDAIVWTTAKTTRLTVTEIQLIEGAISSSLGIIESAAAFLGRQNTEQALDDLILHLSNNKILLVIDNLETVIDNTIRDLVKRVPVGSRILFTTRIGLGAFDFPIPLTPLEKKEAAFYFRQASRVWGVNDLAGANQPTVEGFCERLQNNPLFIKWFVQSVRAGHRPTLIASDPKLLLQFCLQNVFNALSYEAKSVASTLACVSGSQTVASLAFFTDLDSIGIQSALSVLITSNLVSAEKRRNAEDEDRYILSPLARIYIQKFIRPNIETQKSLLHKQKVLRSAQEEYNAKAGEDIFNINNVFVRDKDDFIVAILLKRAIERLFKDDLEKADVLVRRAHDLSPNYFEVHRVEALLRSRQEDMFSAEAAYEAAISLAPDRATLRLWYAGFLSRSLGDQDRAMENLLIAESFASDVPVVLLECARVLLYQRDFEGARDRLCRIPDVEKLPSKTRRVHLDLLLQSYVREADFCVDKERFVDALQSLERLKDILDSSPASLIDRRTVQNVSRAKRQLPALRRCFKGLPEMPRLIGVEAWLFDPNYWASLSDSADARSEDAETIRTGSFDGASEESLPNRGKLSQLHKNYGFIDTGRHRVYFGRSEWRGKTDYFNLAEGQVVSFELAEGPKGIYATNVNFVPGSVDEDPSQLLIVGNINELRATFGYIAFENGQRLFFHRSDCADGTVFRKLSVGDRVRCESHSDNGKSRAIKVELYSGLVP